MKISSKVRGMYHDVEFTGTVVDIEGGTEDVNSDRIHIDLDAPIEVYGVKRDGVVITDDGTRGYSYVEAA